MWSTLRLTWLQFIHCQSYMETSLPYVTSSPVHHHDSATQGHQTNILIDENQTACLSGFGLSTVPECIAERLPYLRADSDFRDAVTIRFMPPELLKDELNDVGTSMDIFSLGCNGLLVSRSFAFRSCVWMMLDRCYLVNCLGPSFAGQHILC